MGNIGIIGYIGKRGQGKSYSMVYEVWKKLRRFKPMNAPDVYSNMAELKCPEAIYIEALQDLPLVANGTALLDEVGAFMGSRSWADLPASVQQALRDGRKDAADILWSAHSLDRVDKVLRELTEQCVHCQRVGRFVQQTIFRPGDKRGRVRFIPFRRDVMALYNTYEKIGSHGGSGGIGEAGLPVSQRAIRRERANADRLLRERQTAERKNPLTYENYFGTYDITGAAKQALAYLQREGRFDSRIDPLTGGLVVPWGAQVREEIRRRLWLRTWGFGPEDAPPECSPQNPWARGFDPLTVARRNVQRKIDELQYDLRFETRKSEQLKLQAEIQRVMETRGVAYGNQSGEALDVGLSISVGGGGLLKSSASAG